MSKKNDVNPSIGDRVGTTLIVVAEAEVIYELDGTNPRRAWLVQCESCGHERRLSARDLMVRKVQSCPSERCLAFRRLGPQQVGGGTFIRVIE